MKSKAKLLAAFAATSMLTLNAPARSQGVTSNVVQGNTNFVIINNSVAGSGNSLASATEFDAIVSLPDRPNRARSLWAHNNSVVALEAQGNVRRFYYHRPRAGMAAAGARPGSLLFEGARSGNRYIGTAHLFAGACGVYGYDVSGDVIADRRVVIQGMAPRVSQDDCRVRGYKNDVLVFDLL